MIRYAAFALSLLLHGMLFVSFGGVAGAPVQQNKIESVTRLSFLTPAPEPTVIPEVIPEKPPEKRKVEPAPKPVKKVVKKKVPKKIVKPVEQVVQEQVVKPQPVLMVAPPVTAAAAVPQVDQGLIKRERERYLSEVMAHVERYKWYPKAARRRGIEGDVTVSFTLHADGTAHEITIENGSDLLISAVRRAIEKAEPMPKPPGKIDCPFECKFRMTFNLKRS